MTEHALHHPRTDPTPIFEFFRGSYGSELLTAAVAHFNLFGQLSHQALTFEDLRAAIGLESRPAHVLITALRAMGLITESSDVLTLTELAKEHLVPGGDFDVGGYVGLAAQSPGVLGMVECLKSNKPYVSNDGCTAFIYRDGVKSAMEAEASARHFTLALAGRAKNVAPALADAVSLNHPKLLLDVGGGTGIYSYAMLQKHLGLKAILFDRPEVLKVAEEMATQYGVLDRVEFIAGDMFVDPLPRGADVILLSNVLHDWDVPECQALVRRCCDCVPLGGRLLIHDVFLNDQLDGPLPIALYSAALFSLTEGRAYSGKEYRSWLRDTELVTMHQVSTGVHCGVIVAMRQDPNPP